LFDKHCNFHSQLAWQLLTNSKLNGHTAYFCFVYESFCILPLDFCTNPFVPFGWFASKMISCKRTEFSCQLPNVQDLQIRRPCFGRITQLILIDHYSFAVRNLLQGKEKKVQRLTKWEIQILESIKTRSQTEKKVAKTIGLDCSIVSPLITDLIMAGYIEIVTKRKLYFFFKKYCALTPDGLTALDNAKGNSILDGVVTEIRNRISEIITDTRDQSPFFNAAWLVADACYKITRFILTR
jgi:DNA-binding MarR family transcriptional regulator